MKLPHRRQFLHLASGAAALPAVSRIARAQTYPTGPVRIVAPYPPGGSVDFQARLIAQWLTDRLRQQFIVENKAGAGGNIGTEAVVRAQADGRTLLLAAPANAINATLYDKLNYDFLRDTAPIAGMIQSSFIMVVHPSHPAKNVSDFIAYAKANPGKVSMGSAGIGTPNHLMGELLFMMTGTKVVHVPYRGEALALTDIISGQVEVLFVSGTVSLEQVRARIVKALAVSTAKRSVALPDVPTIAETFPGYDAGGWAGLCAPRGTSPEIINILNREVNSGLVSAGIRARYDQLGLAIIMGSPADFGKFLADETEKWAKVVKFAGIKAD
jgi:tripartite-type tricarboxylate transporter receptor subunit TctC